jgi:hypothetical protein
MNLWTLLIPRSVLGLSLCLMSLTPVNLSAGDKGLPPELAPIAPNAAVVYWQSFFSLPTLNPEEQTVYQALIAEPHRLPTDDGKKLLERYGRSLADLRRAGNIRVCDWNLDYSQGAELLLPHLQKCRDLCRVALARASLSASEGRIDEATNDIVAVYQAARHCGSSPVLISLLVDVALETSATKVVARHLPKFSSAQAVRFAARLEELPQPCTFAACLRCEGVYFSDWLARKIHAQAARGAAGLELMRSAGLLESGDSLFGEKDEDLATSRTALAKVGIEEVDRWLKRLRDDYAEIARISTLPTLERFQTLAEFEAALADDKKRATDSRFATPEQRDRLISMLMLPAVAKVAEKDARHRALIELLRTALSARASDKPIETGVQIPGVGPIARRDCGDTGYELSVVLPGAAGTVSLVVGEGCEEKK